MISVDAAGRGRGNYRRLKSAGERRHLTRDISDSKRSVISWGKSKVLASGVGNSGRVQRLGGVKGQ